MSLAVSSAGPGDGKTVTTANLGVAVALEGRSVLLVDADERQRALSRLAGAQESRGLTDLADPGLPFEDAVFFLKALPTSRTVGLVPAGTKVEDSAAFFRSPEFRTALARVKASADFTLVDTPPLLAVADTAPVAAQCDYLILVVAAGTPLRVLADVRERLDLVGANLLGYVFNRAQPRGGRLGYGAYGYGAYGYGGYGYADGPDADRSNGKAETWPEDGEEVEESGKRSRNPLRALYKRDQQATRDVS